MNILIISDFKDVNNYILHNTFGKFNCVLPDINYLNPNNINHIKFYTQKYKPNLIIRVVEYVDNDELGVISNFEKLLCDDFSFLYFNIGNENLHIKLHGLFKSIDAIKYFYLKSENTERVGDCIINVIEKYL